MNASAKLNTLLHYALFLLAFSIPTWFIFTSVCMALVAVLWLLQANFRTTWHKISHYKALWPYFLLYLLLAVSYVYSENKGQSAFDLKIKISYILIPLILGAGLGSFDTKKLEQLFLGLIYGVTFTAIICLFDATSVWYFEQYKDAFFYHFLVRSVDPNAVYTAWYTIFSISLLLFMPWQHHFRGKYTPWRYVLLAFLVVFLVLLSARMFLLLFMVLIVPLVIWKTIVRNRQKSIMPVAAILLILIASVVYIVKTDNPVKRRFADLINSDTHIAWLDDYSNVKEEDFDNVTLRLFLWRIGIESVAERNAWLTGTGNGDVHLVLNSKMRAYNVRDIDNPDQDERPGFYNANLHNMYVQTLVMLGVPGLIVFLLVVISPLFYIFKVTPYQPFLIFHVTSLLFMMQEAVLQTQAGIVFYMLISSIFWSIYYSNKDVKY